MIVSLIWQAILLIVLLSFSFGPAFFALINTGIKHGYRTGSILAIGVVTSDCLICLINILLVSKGKDSFIQDDKNQSFMGILAGVILIVFGALYFRRPVKQSDETVEIKKPSVQVIFLKGFFLNSLNPSLWLLWLTYVTAVAKMLQYSMVKMLLYFAITMGLVLFVEFGKVSAANRLKKALTPDVMHKINLVTGVLLLVFGLWLIYEHYFNQFI